MKRLVYVLALTGLLAGCATSVMKSYVGQDVRKVVVQRGAPANVMDMGDGLRAFQWHVQEGYTAPVTANSYGNVNAYGNSAYYNNTTTVTGGQTHNWTCVYTLYARWSEASKGWLVESYEPPAWNCL